MNTNFDESQDDASLDRLLAGARWPDAPAGALPRLRAAAGRRRWAAPLAWGLSAAAAAIALWIGLRPTTLVPPAEPVTRAPDTPTPVVETAVSRPATAAEMLLVQPGPRPSHLQPNRILADALVALDDGASLEQVIESVRPVAQTPYFWREMLRQIARRPADAGRRIELAAAVADERQLRWLLSIYNAGQHSDRVLPAIARLADPTTLLRLARETRDVQHRQLLVAALVDRGSDVVPLIEDPFLRAPALNALHAAASPPVQPLLAALADGSPSTRIAAARGLGVLCHSGALPELERLIQRGLWRREALMALLYCGDGGAADVLRRVSRDPAVAALVRVVELEMNSIQERR